jgi:NitT/TauT family transport system substrate-binding protein
MLLALALACAAPEPTAPPVEEAPPLVKVRVALNWYPEPEFGGYYAALVGGLYEKAGLDVEILPGGPGAPVLEMLASGRAEVAVAAAEDILVRRSKGLDAVAVLPGLQDSPAGLLAHAGGPASIAKVKGRVAIEQGAPFHLFLAATHGWEGKVQVVPTTGTLGPFAADKDLVVQAFVTAEPCVAEAQGLAVTFLPARDSGWNPYASVATVRSGAVDAAWVKAFRDATVEGWKAYLEKPDEANARIGSLNLNLSAPMLACIVKKQAPFVTGTDGVGAMRKERWDALAAALTTVGQPVTADGAWMHLAAPAPVNPAP